jgi:hypothetical protein
VPYSALPMAAAVMLIHALNHAVGLLIRKHSAA